MEEDITIDPAQSEIHKEELKIEGNQADTSKSGSVPFDIPSETSNEDVLDYILNIDQNHLIPWEEVALPSKGLYYGWQDGICKVKAMGHTAEKILATQRLVKSGQSMDYLFNECCNFPSGFDASQLLLGDRIFLLYYIRGITHGNMYEFAVTCPDDSCGNTNTYAYDLNELANTIVYADENLGSEPFKIVLPYLSEKAGREFWVKIRFLRSSDINDIIARKRVKTKMVQPGGVRGRRKSLDPRQQQKQEIILDSAIEDNLEKIIVEVMDSRDLFKIRSMISKLQSKDAATIREWLKNHTPGIDSTIKIQCYDCGSEFTVELPITDGFFRPSNRGGTR